LPLGDELLGRHGRSGRRSEVGRQKSESGVEGRESDRTIILTTGCYCGAVRRCGTRSGGLDVERTLFGEFAIVRLEGWLPLPLRQGLTELL
jgi:hypothetical protein